MLSKYKIFHISDLHFGPEHKMIEPSAMKTEWKDKSGVDIPISDQIFRTLKEQNAACQSTIVICSGDLASYDQPKDFKDAKLFLKRLTSKCGIPRKHILLVPGNHDVYWPAYSATNEATMIKLFRNQFKEFPNPLRKEDGPCYFFPEHRLLVYCFDSCVLSGARKWIPKLDALISKLAKVHQHIDKTLVKELVQIDAGFVSQPKIDDIRKEIDRALSGHSDVHKDTILRIAVLHHHVFPIRSESREFTSLVDAAPLKEELAVHGFHLILHGHKHIPFFCKDSTFSDGSKRSLFVLSSGTMGRRPTMGIFYSFNILKVKNHPAKIANVDAVRKQFDATGRSIKSSSVNCMRIDLGASKGDDKREFTIHSLQNAVSQDLPVAFARAMYDAHNAYGDCNPIRVTSYSITYKYLIDEESKAVHHADHILRFRNTGDSPLHHICLSFAGSQLIAYSKLNVTASYRQGRLVIPQLGEGKVLRDGYLKIVEFPIPGKGLTPNAYALIHINYTWPDDIVEKQSEWGLENWYFREGMNHFTLKFTMECPKQVIGGAQGMSVYYDPELQLYDGGIVETLKISKDGKSAEWNAKPKRGKSLHFISYWMKK